MVCLEGSDIFPLGIAPRFTGQNRAKIAGSGSFGKSGGTQKLPSRYPFFWRYSQRRLSASEFQWVRGFSAWGECSRVGGGQRNDARSHCTAAWFRCRAGDGLLQASIATYVYGAGDIVRWGLCELA